MDFYAPGRLALSGEAVGAAMRLARRRLGLSQRSLADALAWDRAKVGRWEAGQVPEGFEEVLAALRLLGFAPVLTDPAAAEWADWDDPAEHLLDRADRRFPAHLDLCEEDTSSTWNWTRHRGEPSPKASSTSFRRRTPGERMEEDDRARDWEAERLRRGRLDKDVQDDAAQPPAHDAS